MAEAMRFTTVELNAVEAKIASAQDRSLVVELAIFERLGSTFSRKSRRFG